MTQPIAIPLGTTAGSEYTVTVSVVTYAGTTVIPHPFEWREQANAFIADLRKTYLDYGYTAVGQTDILAPQTHVFKWTAGGLPPLVCGGRDGYIFVIGIELSEKSTHAEGGIEMNWFLRHSLPPDPVPSDDEDTEELKPVSEDAANGNETPILTREERQQIEQKCAAFLRRQ